MTKEPTQQFCGVCGQRVPADARFCTGCGRETGLGPPRPTSIRPLTLATVVFVLLLGAGAAALYTVFNEAPLQRAVSGSPGAPAAQAAAPRGGLPSDHPPLELPPEVTAFFDDLAATAERSPDDVEVWKKLARARYRAGMVDPKYNAGALEAVNHVLELQPNDTEAMRMAANIAYEDEKFADAEKLFRRYLELDSKDPGVRTDLASAILFQGRTEEARQMYTDIIKKNPDFVQAHVNLGITLHSEGKREEAMASLKRALELAKEPEQRGHVERIIAAAEGRVPGGATDAVAGTPGEAAAPQPAEAATAGKLTSNATTDFQRDVDQVFASHPIVSPKLVGVNWSGDASASVRLRAFPMDQMPPVVRNKFKSTSNQKIDELVRKYAVQGDVRVELVDDESERVMDTLDGKELIGAFDQPQG